MGRLLVGLAIGAVLGAFGHAWLVAPNASSEDEMAAASPTNRVAHAGAPSAHWGNSPFASGSSAPESTTPVRATELAQSTTMVQPRSTPASTTTPAASPAQAATSDAAASESPSAEAQADPPKVNTFLTDAYSRAIAEDRAHPRSPSQWDDDFTEEPRDANWAGNAERQLSNHFGSFSARGVTLMGVQCHQTLCEMKLTEPMNVPDQFHTAVDTWRNRAFGPVIWQATNGDNGQRYIVAIVRKWPKP